MKLDEYIKTKQIEETVAETLRKEFKSMCIVDIGKYSEGLQKKLFKRAEELTVQKLLDDFFYEVGDNEGQIHEMTVNYGLVPMYIDKLSFGKQFVLRKIGTKVVGCFYRVS